MKTATVNLPKSIINNLRITSLAILLISVYLVIPKTANTTAGLSVVNVSTFSSSGESFTTMGATVQEFKKPYTPPNYGGPDSEHGSGTR